MVLMRTIDADMLAAISSPTWYPALFVDIDWPGGRQRLHNSVGTLTWGGNEWTGIGAFGGAQVPADATGSASVKATLTLHGLLADDLAALASPLPRNREAAIYIGALDRPAGPGAQLVGTPIDLFFGIVDAQQFTVSGEGDPQRPGYSRQHAMRIDIRDGNAPRRAQPLNHGSETQAAAGFTSDTAGRHVIGMLLRRIDWPQA